MQSPTPSDIYGTAYILLRRHGEEALSHVAEQVAELKAAGDEENLGAWLAVQRAMNELLEMDRKGPIH